MCMKEKKSKTKYKKLISKRATKKIKRKKTNKIKHTVKNI